MADQESNKVYVGNMSFKTNEDMLHEAFGCYGTVSDCIVITDRETGRSRGFGFVTFESPEEAKEAIKQLNDSELEGRTIKVSLAKTREGGGGGGGYRGGGGGYRGGGGGGGYGGGGYGGGGGGYGGGGRSGYQEGGGGGYNSGRSSGYGGGGGGY